MILSTNCSVLLQIANLPLYKRRTAREINQQLAIQKKVWPLIFQLVQRKLEVVEKTYYNFVEIQRYLDRMSVNKEFVYLVLQAYIYFNLYHVIQLQATATSVQY
jgi:hypothetical protein